MESKIILTIKIEYIGQGKRVFAKVEDFFSKLRLMGDIDKIEIILDNDKGGK